LFCELETALVCQCEAENLYGTSLHTNKGLGLVNPWQLGKGPIESYTDLYKSSKNNQAVNFFFKSKSFGL
jgi:hypothetical protein